MSKPDLLPKLILENAKAKISTKAPLSEVERIVLREYVTVCRARLNALQLKSQKQMLTDAEYARMQGLDEEILKYGGENE